MDVLENFLVLDKESGELVDKRIVVDEFKKEAKKELAEAKLNQTKGLIEKDKKEEQRKKANNSFVNNNMNKIGDVMEVLTRPQRGLLVILLCYLDYIENGGKLVYMDKKKEKLTKAKIKEILPCTKQALNRFIKACEENNIMHYNIEKDEFIINKEVAFKGGYKGSEKQVVSMRTIEIKHAIEELKPVQLGLIYDLQQFINTETHMLCSNPNEKDVNKLIFLTQKELAEGLDVSTSFLEKNLQRLIINNQRILVKIVNGREVRLMVNPNFVFRGDFDTACKVVQGVQNKSIQAIFRA